MGFFNLWNKISLDMRVAFVALIGVIVGLSPFLLRPEVGRYQWIYQHNESGAYDTKLPYSVFDTATGKIYHFDTSILDLKMRGLSFIDDPVKNKIIHVTKSSLTMEEK